MRLSQLVDTSQAVSATRKRKEKTARLAALLRSLEEAEQSIGARFLAGEIRQGRIGIGYAAIAKTKGLPAADAPTLTLGEVDRLLDEIAHTKGAGSAKLRTFLLERLLTQATPAEQDFLRKLLIGELRQGALEGVLMEAVAEAAGIPTAEVRRARMLAGEVGSVLVEALKHGRAGLERFALTLFTPVHPMLAATARGVEDALSKLSEAALEVKLDGARVQVHKDGAEVRVYSRRLNEVTAAVPEVVEAVRALPARRAILDGETIALEARGRPQPFQVTMRRYGRRLDVEALRREIPLSTFFFDMILCDDAVLLDTPARDRIAALTDLIPAPQQVTRLTTSDVDTADAFLSEVLAQGHEGLMAKDLYAPYEAGHRGSSWLKLKPVHTLDLVVIAAEWGSGRRRGWLSNLHLAALNPADQSFIMLGKTFKGLTDELLAWQTTALLAREIGRENHVVHVRPELVVEIAFDGLQDSPHYPGGLALRFARVKRYRPDKLPQDADTIDKVRSLHGKRPASGPGANIPKIGEA